MTENHTTQNMGCPCCHAKLEVRFADGIIVSILDTGESCKKRSYLEWAGDKITELNTKVRELEIRQEKTEVVNTNRKHKIKILESDNKKINKRWKEWEAKRGCIHNWIPYVSDKFFSRCSKCGEMKND